MDQVTRAWYGMHIKCTLLEKNEQGYEDFFCEVMEALHSDNFQLVKAAGQDGDGKADGYLIPEKCVFQSYAPSSGFQKYKLLKKIEGDFTGAVSKWGDKLTKWVFVHNGQEGLPKYSLDLITDLKAKNPKIDIAVWSPTILRDMALSLPVAKLVVMFGLAPTQSDMTSLTHEPIKTLLKAMVHNSDHKITDICPVSVKKLQYNELSEDVEALLTAGRRKENLVGDLLLKWPDPDYGEDLAQSFRSKYQNLKSSGYSPDNIFVELKAFAGGNIDNITAQVSSLAVLSYFFERCDIYDNPPIGGRA